MVSEEDIARLFIAKVVRDCEDVRENVGGGELSIYNGCFVVALKKLMECIFSEYAVVYTEICSGKFDRVVKEAEEVLKVVEDR